MNKIIFTGTASGFPAKDRANASFILMAGKRIYQFDAGEGFSSSVQRLKIDYSNIGKIFISHLHPDHITGIFLELQLMLLAKRQLPLEIFVPAEGVAGLEQAARMFYLFKEKFPFEFRFSPIIVNPAYREGNFVVYAYANQHLTPNKDVIRKTGAPNKMQSFSFVIVIDGKKILYTGDILNERDLVGLLDDTHLVITEGMHGDFESLTATLGEAGIKRLVLTHLTAESFARPQKLIKIANKNGVKKVIIARDGLKLSI
jgi:ribonuclease BN (tRNA processing enzyme)